MEGLNRAIGIAGSQQALANRINHFLPPGEQIGQSAISEWLRRGRVPGEKVIPLCKAVDFGVRPHEIRLDLYPHPEDGLPEERRALAALDGISDVLTTPELASLESALQRGPESAIRAIEALEPDLQARAELLRDAESRS